MILSHGSFLPLAPDQEVKTSSDILAWPASHYPEKTGLICGERNWTFAQLDTLANRFANSVLNRFSDSDGPIAMMGGNSAEYYITHYGTSRTGRYVINLPTRCTVEDIMYSVKLSRPVLIIHDVAAEAVITEALTQTNSKAKTLVINDDDVELASAFWQFVDSGQAIKPDCVIDPEAPGSVIFTGGTTGRPKAVVSSQYARAVSAMAGIEDFRIQTDTVAGFSVPFTHTAGLFSWSQPAVLAGCTGVIIPRWDPVLFMDICEKHGINVIFAVPTQLATLLDHPEFDPQRLKSLKFIAFGGAPLAKSLIERAESAMPWFECRRAYGSTETGHLAAQVKADRVQVYDGFNNPGGRLEIELFKSPGVVAEMGEVGEIATRGPHLFTRYLDNEEAMTSFFKTDETDGSWGWMGDLAERCEGYFRIIGRSKNMILSGGLNIYPTELEEILIAHPDVLDCVVFGVEDETWGELPAAAVVMSGDEIENDDLLTFVANKVARYKRVRYIYRLDEIPRTAAGKAQTEQVKRLCLEQT